MSYGATVGESQRVLRGEPDAESSSLRWHFFAMASCFAVNHGLCTTTLVVASTVLGDHLAFSGLAVLYSAAMFASVCLTGQLVTFLGPETCMVFGMVLWCGHLLCFTMTLCTSSVHARWLIWILGSFSGGLAGGFVWTAQGVYISTIASALVAVTGETREVVTARLAGNFSFVFLLVEVLSRLTFSALRGWAVPTPLITAMFCALASLSPLALMRAKVPACMAESSSVPSRREVATEVCGHMRETLAMWSDPALWLLSPTNIAFGCSAALLNGYVNSDLTAPELGKDSVAYLSAVVVVVAALVSALSSMSASVVGKGAVLTLGAACFTYPPLALLALRCCSGWKLWIITLYIAQGVGRGVYESTNRAAIADQFPGPRASCAFANCAFQSNLASASCFILQDLWRVDRLACVVVAFSMSIPVSFSALGYINGGSKFGAYDETVRLRTSPGA